jgi:hypothetical protein
MQDSQLPTKSHVQLEDNSNVHNKWHDGTSLFKQFIMALSSDYKDQERRLDDLEQVEQDCHPWGLGFCPPVHMLLHFESAHSQGVNFSMSLLSASNEMHTTIKIMTTHHCTLSKLTLCGSAQKWNHVN